MASAESDEFHETAAKAVAELVNKRIEIKAQKKTLFQTFLEVTKEDFEAENPDKFFEPSFEKLTEKHWEEMPDADKDIYRQLNAKQHELIDAKWEELSREIIAARPGERTYGGVKIQAPLDAAQNDDDDANKLTFNPIFWFAMEEHVKNEKKPNCDWKERYRTLLHDAAIGWPALPSDLQEKYVFKAAVERKLYYNDLSIEDYDHKEAIYNVLTAKLAEAQIIESKKQASEQSAKTCK